MELTLKELNEIYYGLSVLVSDHALEHKLIDTELIDGILKKVMDEIDIKTYESES